MNAVAETGETVIRPEQVRVGVHVRIPLAWSQHAFLTSSFVVSNEQQVREILAMGVEVLCDTRKCRVPPMPLVEIPAPDPAREAELATLRAEQEARMAVRRERQAAMEAMRSRLDKVQKSFQQAAEQTAAAMHLLGARPKESLKTILGVAGESTNALLADTDSTILMVMDKGASQGEVAHAISVMTLSLLLGKRLGIPAAVLREIGAGALLHDIGLASLNHSLVRNPKRNRFEEASYQTHCVRGHRELQAIGFVVPPEILNIALQHHEHYDGTGYPNRLSGTAICQGARIVALADRFDELTNPPEPSGALSPFEALAQMWTRERSHFDEMLLQHFIRSMGIYPPGTLVQLSDGRVAIVVAAAPAEARLCPQVLLYDAGTPRSEGIILDLARPDPHDPEPLRIEKALRTQDLGTRELDYLLPRRRMSWLRAGP
jgi:HD-GYP domain-containing protein (c-di-GMP phosphodiesterase class II)